MHYQKISLFLFVILMMMMSGSAVSAQLADSAESADSIESVIQIEVANETGVVGYPISMFGSGFGETAGDVTILGESAEITHWTPTSIRATIPFVGDGTGEIVIKTDDGRSATTPFAVYSVDPIFLESPTQTFQNVLTGRQAVVNGMEWSYCAAQPENEEVLPELFLSNYRCGYSGIVRSGLVVLSADSERDRVATISYRFSEPLSGTYVFQFMTDNVWYPRKVESSYLHSVPRDYFLEVSADSSDGIDGTWKTVVSIDGNNRSSRTHTFNVSTEDAAMWFRMRTTDALGDHTEFEGRDFAVREVRLFKASGDSAERPDAATIYGDSLTADAFQALGFSGLPHAVKELRDGTENDLLFTSYGLAGQNSSGLTAQENVPFDIYDALELDDAQTRFRYWFIAIGTNDALDGTGALDKPGTNLYQYHQRLDQFVQDAIGRGLVPIVARIPQTDESAGGFGDPASKQKVLSDIDTIAARYRLIPGPDLYADFRLNLELDEGSFFGGDGTHHVDLGGQRLINAWAEAFVNGFEIAAATELLVQAQEAALSVSATETAVASQPESTPTPFPTINSGEESEGVLASTVGEVGDSAENSRPIWQAVTLFVILILLSLGIILALFKHFKLL